MIAQDRSVLGKAGQANRQHRPHGPVVSQWTPLVRKTSPQGDCENEMQLRLAISNRRRTMKADLCQNATGLWPHHFSNFGY
jgi:hypothetical protein